MSNVLNNPVIVIHDRTEINIYAVVRVVPPLTPQETFERWCYIEKEDAVQLQYDLMELVEVDEYDHDRARTTRESLGQAMTAVHEMMLEDITSEIVEEAIKLDAYEIELDKLQANPKLYTPDEVDEYADKHDTANDL